MNGCKRIALIEAAKSDLEEGFWFYEEQQAGLGDYFLNSLQSDIDSLLVFAGVHAKPYRNSAFRALSRNFPYAVFYCLTNDTAHVVAVLDTRRDPQHQLERLQELP